jgi:hypothetical protein
MIHQLYFQTMSFLKFLPEMHVESRKSQKGDLHDFFDACFKLLNGVSRRFDWFTRGSGLDKALTGESFTDGHRVLPFRSNAKVLATDCGESGLASQWESDRREISDKTVRWCAAGD